MMSRSRVGNVYLKKNIKHLSEAFTLVPFWEFYVKSFSGVDWPLLEIFSSFVKVGEKNSWRSQMYGLTNEPKSRKLKNKPFSSVSSYSFFNGRDKTFSCLNIIFQLKRIKKVLHWVNFYG